MCNEINVITTCRNRISVFTLTDLEYKEMFKQEFNEEAAKFLTGVTVGEAPCQGGIQTVTPSYIIFGNCFELSCKFEEK